MRYGRTMKIGNVLADLEKRLLRQLMGLEKTPADRRDQPAGEQGHEEPPTPVEGRGGGADGLEIMPKR